MLRDLGVDFAQGYHLGKPAPGVDLRAPKSPRRPCLAAWRAPARTGTTRRRAPVPCCSPISQVRLLREVGVEGRARRARPPRRRWPTRSARGGAGRGRRPCRSTSRSSGTSTSSASAAASASSLPVEAEVAGRAGRVDRDRAEPAGDLELRQQAVVRPRDRVEDLELRVALGVLLGQRRRRPRGEPVRARARVDHDRQLPPAAPAPQRLDGLVRHRGVARRVALRAPRHRAAVPGDVVGDPDRQPGAGRDRDQRLGQLEAAVGRAARPCRRSG